jgi:hypothetical protein
MLPRPMPMLKIGVSRTVIGEMMRMMKMRMISTVQMMKMK